MKKAKKIIFIIILIVIVGTATFFIGRQIGLNTDTSTTTTTIEEVEVSTQTITKTLTGSGEISSSTTENLELDTSLYFEMMCVEEDDIVEEGENILEYTDGTYLVAPYRCIVSNYSVPETESICEDTNFIQIQDMTNLTTSLSVNESEISYVEEGQNVEIVLEADTSITYTGTISKIASSGTYSSSGTTFAVTVSFTNDGNAKLGMSVSSTINIESLEDVIAVPIDAVQINGSTRYVIVVNDDGTTTETEVETGLSDDSYVQITSGLEGGEIIQVVTETTESTIRSDSDDESSDFGGMSGGGDMSGGTMDIDTSSIPSGGGATGGGDMGGGGMP